MRISSLTLNDSKEYVAIGNGPLANVCQWPIGEEPQDRHFDKNATKEFQLELRKQLKKNNKRVGSQPIDK